MPIFAYQAADLQGQRLSGREEAASAAELIRQVERRGLLLLNFEVARPRPQGGRGKRRRDALDFTRAVASLLAAGLPLVRALEISESLLPDRSLIAVRHIRRQVERGEPLHAALRSHDTIFTPVYLGVVRAGEQSGDLTSAFLRLEFRRTPACSTTGSGNSARSIRRSCCGTSLWRTVINW